MSEDDMAQAWDCESEIIAGVFEDGETQGGTALTTPVRCSVCSTAPCACDRFIADGIGFGDDTRSNTSESGWHGDEQCSACKFAPCACELLDMQSAQRKAAEDVFFVIGEGVYWLTRNEVVMAGKIIAPCNANGDARILDAGGNTHLINKAWICRHRDDSPTASEYMRTLIFIRLSLTLHRGRGYTSHGGVFGISDAIMTTHYKGACR